MRSQRTGERIYLPDLMLLQAQIELGEKRPDAARSSMRAAIVEARAQQALWLELSALVALCGLHEATLEDLVALKDVRGRLREGLDRTLMDKANQLLRANKRGPRSAG